VESAQRKTSAPKPSAPGPSRLRIGTRYRASRLQGPYDAIVIGSGIGGLTSAAMLSAAGKKVLVLEQHYTAGGFTHAYDRNGYEWDVGVHYIGDVGGHPTITRKLFDFVSGGNLHWAPMDSTYDRICIGEEQFDLRAGRERTIHHRGIPAPRGHSWQGHAHSHPGKIAARLVPPAALAVEKTFPARLAE
jgi:phytoene dehydrogenase-like protein